jgi:FkbM family methyltransferase
MALPPGQTRDSPRSGRFPAVARRLGRPILYVYRNVRLAALGTKARWCRVVDNLAMIIDPSDYVDRAFYVGSYEPHLIRFIRDHVATGDVCVDVGAHKGYVTLHLAHAVGPTDKVIAIEPDPRAAQQLRRNVQRNRLQNVTVYACAAADRAGTCDFTLSRQLGWSSRFMNELAKPTAMTSVSVQMRTLDEILSQARIQPGRHRLSFIKIDTEGSEPLVLRGAAETLRIHSPTLLVEINRSSLRAGNFSAQDVAEAFRRFGYQMYRILPDSPQGSARGPRLAPVESLASTGEPDCFDIVALARPPEGTAGLDLP